MLWKCKSPLEVIAEKRVAEGFWVLCRSPATKQQHNEEWSISDASDTCQAVGVSVELQQKLIYIGETVKDFYICITSMEAVLWLYFRR